jgi:hypothetical protein
MTRLYSKEQLYMASADDWLCRLVQYTIDPQDIEDPEIANLWRDARVMLNKIEELIGEPEIVREDDKS